MTTDAHLIVPGIDNRPFFAFVTREHGYNEDNGPIVEIYDASQSEEVFGPKGQFVSSYYLSTLQKTKANNRALPMYGPVPAWTLEAWAVQAIVEWAEAELAKEPV